MRISDLLVFSPLRKYVCGHKQGAERRSAIRTEVNFTMVKKCFGRRRTTFSRISQKVVDKCGLL